MNSHLIVGCGYLGLRVAKRLLANGDHVTVVTRCGKRAEELTAAGFETLVADVTQPATLKPLLAGDYQTLLYAVGFDRSAEPSIDEVYPQGLQNVLEQMPQPIDTIKRIVYISTTGVYGSADGGWVDETTSPAPCRAGGIASLAAEERLLASRFADRAVVLRLAGIYGPDRLPYLKQLQTSEPIAAPQTGYLNLIHVDDATEVVLAALKTSEATDKNAHGIYCVSDGNPPIRSDYYAEMARLLNAPSPNYSTPPTDSPRAARAAADKRISNGRVLEELNVVLRYPSYREGLAAIVASVKE